MPPLPIEFQPVFDDFTHGRIHFDEMVRIGKTVGINIKTYNPITDRNPAYPEGNNDSRIGFTNDIHLSEVGNTFQRTLKPKIIKCINIIYVITHYLGTRNGMVFKMFKPMITKALGAILKYPSEKLTNRVDKWAVKKWDKDSFVFDDPRMKVLSDSIHEYIDECFDHQDRKLEFMHKLADICLFMLKEDIYYRARAFDMLNKMPKFGLHEQEEENIVTFTRGVEVVNQFTLKPVKNHPANANIPKESTVC